MEIKWNGQTIENLLVGTYLNTLCISLKEKELLVEMEKWEKSICDRFTFFVSELDEGIIYFYNLQMQEMKLPSYLRKNFLNIT